MGIMTAFLSFHQNPVNAFKMPYESYFDAIFSTNGKPGKSASNGDDPESLFLQKL